MISMFIDGFVLMKPFSLDNHHDVLDESTERGSVFYRSKTMRDALAMFMHRDIIPIFSIFVFVSIAIVTPSVTGVTPFINRVWPRIAAGFLIVILFVYVRLRSRPISPHSARIIGWLNFAIVLLIVSFSSLNVPSSMVHCINSRALAPESALENERYCARILHPYVMTTMILLIPAISMGTFRSAVAAFLIPVAYLAGFAIAQPVTARIWGPQVFYFLISALMTAHLCYCRNATYAIQFEQALQLAVAQRGLQLQKHRVDGLLRSMLPAVLISRLLRGEVVKDIVPSATVFFSDVQSFTKWSSSRSAFEVAQMLHSVCVLMDSAAAAASVTKVATIGDAYWCVSGVPLPRETHAEDIVTFAQRAIEIVATVSASRDGWREVSIRVGVHSGPVAGAIVGRSSLCYELFGDANQVCEEVEQSGIAGSVVLTDATRQLLPPDIASWCHAFKMITPRATGEPLQLHRLVPPQPTTPMTTAAFGDDEGDADDIADSDGVATVTPQTTGAGGGTQRRRATKPPSIAPPTEAHSRDGDQPNQREREGSDRSGGSGNDGSDGEGDELVLIDLDDARREVLMRNRLSVLALGASRSGRVDDDDDDDRLLSSQLPRRASTSALELLGDRFGREHLETRCGCVDVFRSDATLVEYLKFSQLHNAMLSISGRLMCAALQVTSLAVFLWELGDQTPAATILVLVVSAVSTATAALTKVFMKFPRVEMALFVATWPATVFACWLAPGSVAGSSLVYWCAPYGIAISMCIVGMGTAARNAVYVVFVGVPVTIASLRTVDLAALNTILFCCLGTGILSSVHEQMRRRQFFEHHCANKTLDETRTESSTQELLLAQMAPPHAIAELLEWFDRRMDVGRAIGHLVDGVCVAFIKIVDLSANFNGEGHLSPRNGNSASPHSLARRHVEQLVDFILRTQSAVDAVLGDEMAFVSKIKVMNSTTLMAGPFGSDASASTPRVVGAALLRIAARLRSGAVPGVSCIAGMHFGTVGSAIIGQSRVAFDIFGATVNTASRVLTNCCVNPGDVFVSKAFAAAVFGPDFVCDGVVDQTPTALPLTRRGARERVLESADNPLAAATAAEVACLSPEASVELGGKPRTTVARLRRGHIVAMKGVEGGMACHEVIFTDM